MIVQSARRACSMLRFLSRSDRTFTAEGEAETKNDSINEKPTQELSRNYEGKASKMGPVITIVSPRRDDGLECEMGPLTPSCSANGYSTVQESQFADIVRPSVVDKIKSESENLAGEETRAMGEAQIFGDGGPADEPLSPFPVTEGMESVDELTAHPSFV